MEKFTFLEQYSGIIFQVLLIFGFVVFIIFISKYLGPRRKSQRKLENFECGIEQQGNARFPISIRYFLTAILFVLFDVEVIFFYPWAINFRALGSSGFLKMIIFIIPLLLGFFYILKKGALKWENKEN